MAAKKALPRLGSAKAPKPNRRQEEVTIPERGVSVLLEQPSVEDLLAMQDLFDDDSDTRDSYTSAVKLVADMLVDPDWDVEQLKTEVNAWSMNDWQVLQTAAIELSGLKGELAVEAEFPGSED